MEDILIGTTDRTILVFIPDPASTTGAGKTGLAAAAITATYTRVETDNDVVHNDVTSSLTDLSALTDAHSDWGWKEVSATLSKGLYRLDLADAVFASGAWYAVVQVTITSGTAAATPKAFRLVARNDLDGVRLGLTALPNAAADAAGGLPISDAGGLDMDAQLVTKINDILTDTGTTLDDLVDDLESRLGTPVGASISADIAAVKAQAAALETDTQDIQTRLPAALAADGSIKATIMGFLGTAFTEGAAGRFAANFKTFFNVGSATGTQDVIPTVTDVTNEVDADVKKINATTVNGTGSAGDPWGPA